MFNPFARHSWDSPPKRGQPREITMSAGAVTAILDYNRPAHDEGVVDPPKTGNKIFVFILLGLAALIAVGILVTPDAATISPTPAESHSVTDIRSTMSDGSVVYTPALFAAAVPCNVPLTALTNKSKTLRLVTATHDDLTLLVCLLTHLHFPVAVGDRIGATTREIGSQSAAQDGVSLEWSFTHPGDGTNTIGTFTFTVT